MKRKTLMVVALLSFLFLSSLWLLRSYRVELVQMVVVGALIQKSPGSYPEDRIREIFHNCARKAGQDYAEEEYLEGLFRISQRLEKVQSLSVMEIEALLGSFQTNC